MSFDFNLPFLANRRAALSDSRNKRLGSEYPSPRGIPTAVERSVSPSYLLERVSLALCVRRAVLEQSFIIARRVSPLGSRHKGSFLYIRGRVESKILLMCLLVCVRAIRGTRARTVCALI